MKLEYLKLTNFRGFREFEISFDPFFTVLLGANMAGKTAVLEGAAATLGTFLQRREPKCDIRNSDVYQIVSNIGGVPELQQQFPVVIEAHATIDPSTNKSATWQFFRANADAPTRPDGEHFHVLNLPATTDLPIIAQYGTQRHWDESNAPADLRGVGSRYDGYTNCFNIRFTHSALAGWMRKQTLVQLQRGGGYIQPQLAAVEAAVKCCIEGVTRFWFDVQYDELRLERTGGDIQSFAMLSEGVRNMVAMVADIAWRTAVLNPQYGTAANLLTEGIVLIDELDLHLHPAWQRRIVNDLRRTFPRTSSSSRRTHRRLSRASLAPRSACSTTIDLSSMNCTWKAAVQTRSSRTSSVFRHAPRKSRMRSRRCIA